MTHRKTAIAVPEDVLAAVDRAARARGESRSRFISRVLRLAVRAQRDAEVTRRLDALFADEPLRAELALAGPERASRFSWKTTALLTLDTLVDAAS